MSASASEPGIADLNTRVAQFRERMRAARAAVEGVDFYPYDTLGNLRTVDELLRHSRCNLQQLSGGLPVADLGAGDGDLAGDHSLIAARHNSAADHPLQRVDRAHPAV